MTTSIKTGRSENTRQSIYTSIRYVSKFIKLRTDLRKSHPSVINEKMSPVPLDDDSTLYDGKDEKKMNWLRNESQLIFPSRFPSHQVHEIANEEEELDSSDCDPEDYIDDSEPEYDAYTTAWRKLSGYTLSNEEPKTAVLINLSPSALAAANAARLRRKRVPAH